MLMKHGSKVLQIGMMRKASRQSKKDQELVGCLEVEKVDMGKDEEGADANENARSTKLCSERRKEGRRPKLKTLIATYRMNVIWSL